MKQSLTLKQIEVLEDLKEIINQTDYNPSSKKIADLIVEPKTKTKKLQSSIQRRMKK